MPGFLYFIADATAKPKTEDLEALGLAYIVDRPQDLTYGIVIGRGPSGGKGVVVASSQRVTEDVGYHPDRQEWILAPGLPKPVWIGWYKDQLPTPRDLVRRRWIDGPPIELADGRRWFVPLVECWGETDGGGGRFNALPSLVDLDDDGEYRMGDVLPIYKTLEPACDDYWVRVKIRGERLDVKTLLGYAATVLGNNYAVGIVELVKVYRAMTLALAGEILDLAVDWPTYVDWVQKKSLNAACDGNATSPGGPDSCPDTDPPTSTSSPSTTTSEPGPIAEAAA